MLCNWAIEIVHAKDLGQAYDWMNVTGTAKLIIYVNETTLTTIAN